MKNGFMKFSTFSPNDKKAISQLFLKTFTDSEGQDEGELVGKLADDLMTNTDAKDLQGYVATEKGQIVACIFFSRMTFADGVNAFLLSPVAVVTRFQGQGIGQKLINYGIDLLKEQGISLVMTYGDPAFYSKVGFKPISATMIKPPFKLSQPEGWLGLSLTGKEIKPVAGDSSCVTAFNNPSLW